MVGQEVTSSLAAWDTAEEQLNRIFRSDEHQWPPWARHLAGRMGMGTADEIRQAITDLGQAMDAITAYTTQTQHELDELHERIAGLEAERVDAETLTALKDQVAAIRDKTAALALALTAPQDEGGVPTEQPPAEPEPESVPAAVDLP